MECGAKTKSGAPCKAPSMENGRCRIHGGKTPKGTASPHYQGKGKSKYLPQPLIEAYEEARSNPELLAVRDDIAIGETLLISALSRLESRESGKAWTLMKKSVEQLQEAFANENYGKCVVVTQAMRDVIDENVLHFATEDEIRTNLEQLRKLKESERKRLVDMQQMVTSEQALLLVSALLDAVRRNIHDTNTLNIIQSEFIRLTTLPNHHRIDSGDSE